MAYDGNGNFLRLHNWTSDAANNIDINAGEMDGEDNGFAAGLTLCVTRDGQGKMAADFLPSAAATYNLGTVGVPWLNIAAKSGTIGPPATGTAWTVNGVAGFNTVQISGAATSGQSFGLQISAGTTSADYPVRVNNQANSQTFFQISGDGGVTVGAPTGGDLGLGTLNVATTLALAGNPVYAGIPPNNQSANYTTVLADANKAVVHTNASAHTFTIAANASVAYPIGTALTFCGISGAGTMTIAINTDTLRWAAGGGTGSRTLAGTGIATAYKVNTNEWIISGTGLS